MSGIQLTSLSSVFGIKGEERVVVSERREGRGRSPSSSAPSSVVPFALSWAGGGRPFYGRPLHPEFSGGERVTGPVSRLRQPVSVGGGTYFARR